MVVKRGVFNMRKVIMIMLLVLSLFNLMSSVMIKVNADNHSHEDFESLSSYDYRKLFLDEISKEEIAKAHKKAKRRLFGWSFVPIKTKEDVQYTGMTVFSKHNDTSNRLDFTYNYESTERISKSIKTTNSLTSDLGAKIELVNLGFDTALKLEVGEEHTKTVTESTKILIIIDPYTSLTIRTKGNAILSNGVAHLHVLGVKIKKGEWEYVNVETEYYEFLEEALH